MQMNRMRFIDVKMQINWGLRNFTSVKIIVIVYGVYKNTLFGNGCITTYLDTYWLQWSTLKPRKLG